MTPRATLFVLTAFGYAGIIWPSVNAAAQDPKLAVRPRKPDAGGSAVAPSIRADVSLILVPVNVTDALDRPITALPKESFRLLEDGVEQSIVSFSREEAPVSMGLLFDTSGSMKNRLAASMESIRYLFQST